MSDHEFKFSRKVIRSSSDQNQSFPHINLSMTCITATFLQKPDFLFKWKFEYLAT